MKIFISVLSKKFRLTDRKDFERIHKYGEFFGHKFLAVKVVKNNLEFTRFGFIIGTKISKKATIRNRARRKLQESVRLKLKEIKPGVDIVIFVRPEIINKNYWEIDEEIIKVLEKARLLKDSV